MSQTVPICGHLFSIYTYHMYAVNRQLIPVGPIPRDRRAAALAALPKVSVRSTDARHADAR
ncbi:hypothetical protein MesoLjLc_12700 [Mesorhizobium sp. L-8-10]|nr:hypothetical protein MesoLjLc_12700 [Mesorhizobium sp. L-8-10]